MSYRTTRSCPGAFPDLLGMSDGKKLMEKKLMEKKLMDLLMDKPIHNKSFWWWDEGSVRLGVELTAVGTAAPNCSG